MKRTEIMRGADDNLHAQIKFDGGWVNVDKLKDNSPATITVAGAKLEQEEANKLKWAIDKALKLASEADSHGTELYLQQMNC